MGLEQIDLEAVKLGRRPAVRDRRTLRLGAYLDFNKLAPAPLFCDWLSKIPQYGMLGNDTAGDCVQAALAHLRMVWTAWTTGEITLTTQQVLALYGAMTGYPASDNGTNELSALSYMQKTGWPDGDKIGPYVSIDIANDLEVLYAIWWFGGLLIGINMPNSAKGQPTLWDVVPGGDGGPWGGHAVLVGSYPDPGISQLGLITWGQRIAMTKAFWKTYTEETYAILSPDWANGTKVAPSGFAYQDLLSDLAAITGGPLPTPVNPTPPAPNPYQNWDTFDAAMYPYMAGNTPAARRAQGYYLQSGSAWASTLLADTE